MSAPNLIGEVWSDRRRKTENAGLGSMCGGRSLQDSAPTWTAHFPRGLRGRGVGGILTIPDDVFFCVTLGCGGAWGSCSGVLVGGGGRPKNERN